MNNSDLETPDTNWERVAAIQRLCKRQGLFGGKTHPPETLELFGVKSQLEFSKLINTAFMLTPKWPPMTAIGSALGFGFISGTGVVAPESLTDRRTALAIHLGVSVSTVMRFEHSGAVILDDYIRRLTDTSDPDWLISSMWLGLEWINSHATELKLDSLLTENAAEAAFCLSMERSKFRVEAEKAQKPPEDTRDDTMRTDA
ncbi:hypothetical protein QN355_19485 [Cryobacterium sp. 10S3]|uniref:hypothetical protein n=1 Tax=Cryobacterium sp. 10S3 TaxID=3048582 RepID=UPI002AC8E60D|nr:hypothetical protein [Cryobacterium sp. 10S3]MEB0288713.1 hypothetical protein [Cryobacterium sp. 10S3]WPX14213.1 hypothetical protein RHM57_02220 [Cryobacterium sp. 10S3]